MMTKLLFVLSSVLVLTACGKAEITSDCTLNGRGDVSCTFKNNGNTKGSTCEYIALVSKDKERPATMFAVIKESREMNIKELLDALRKKGIKKVGINDELIPMLAQGLLRDENRIFSGTEICSGVVEPQDVRKSEAFVNFMHSSPYEICDRGFEDSWTTKCGFTTYRKEQVVAMLNELLSSK